MIYAAFNMLQAGGIFLKRLAIHSFRPDGSDVDLFLDGVDVTVDVD